MARHWSKSTIKEHMLKPEDAENTTDYLSNYEKMNSTSYTLPFVTFVSSVSFFKCATRTPIYEGSD